MSEAATMLNDGAQTNTAATSTADVATTASQTAADVNTDATQQTATTDTSTDAKGDGDSAAQNVAPEKYDFKAPEGVTFDGELVGEFEGIAKELGLSQANAQKVTDIGAKMAQKFQSKQAEAMQQLSTEWVAAATSDKEFGGEKLNENLAVAQKALTTFGTPELRGLLEQSGLGNNPEVIRFMYRAGMAISEDKLVTGGARSATDGQSSAQRLFPNMNP